MDTSQSTPHATQLASPVFADVLRARRQIAPYLARTPLRRYPSLGEKTGADIWVKHENLQPTGAFKVRGGVNLISQLSPTEREAGVIAASTGNHGQSVAYAAALFGVRAIILVPERANQVKVESMRALGAEVIEFGRDFDDAREECERMAAQDGNRYVHSGNEPLLIAGVATATLELLEDEPGIEVIVVPVGGGSGAAAACIVANAIDPTIEVIGVQSEAAPAGFLSWRDRALRQAPMATFAEGLATRTAFALPQRIMQERLDDFILVSDDEIRQAQLLLLEKTRTLVEAAGATSLAGALVLGGGLAGKRVALICSGANVTLQQLRDLLLPGQ